MGMKIITKKWIVGKTIWNTETETTSQWIEVAE